MTTSFMLLLGASLVVLAALHWLLFRLVKRAMSRPADDDRSEG
ncbi:hypothetical protein [Halomonas nitroreducens]|nr:hypothetical protein [Halomonas nitroreducens]